MDVARNVLRRALRANAVAVVAPALVLVVAWFDDLLGMGLLGLLLGGFVFVPAAVVAAGAFFLARSVSRSEEGRLAPVAAVLLGVAQFFVAVLGIAEATALVESVCFGTIGATAIAVATAGVVTLLRSGRSASLLPRS